MRRVTDVLDCWFESGLHALRPGPLSLREPRVVRGALPGRLHRRVHRPDPGLVLHLARAGHRPVRPARRSRPAWPTASCSATTARRCPSACATTPTPRPCSTSTAPTPCAGSCCRRRCCAAATWSPTRRASSTPSAPACCPLWNAWYFFTLYANADGRRADLGPGPTPPGVLDRYILAKAHELVAAVTARHGRLRPVRGVRTPSSAFLDALTNWYIRRSRDRFWGTERHDRADDARTPSTPWAPSSRCCAGLAAPLLPW